MIAYHGQLTKAALKQIEASLESTPRVIHVIVATSVADCSVTFHLCRAVFDSCIIKQPKLDVLCNVDVLTKFWTGQDNRTQRKGRTGRQCPGIVVQFVPEANKGQHIGTDVERVKLDNVVLRCLTIADTPAGRVRTNLVN